MADGSPVAYNRSGSSGLHSLPAQKGLFMVVTEPENGGCVNARTLWIEMRQVGKSMHPLAFLGHGLMEGGFQGRHHGIHLWPVRDGFKGVHAIAFLPQGIPQVGGSETILRPFAAEVSAQSEPCGPLKLARCHPARAATLRSGSCNGHNQHTFPWPRPPPSQ